MIHRTLFLFAVAMILARDPTEAALVIVAGACVLELVSEMIEKKSSM